jgi:hypothetical protein
VAFSQDHRIELAMMRPLINDEISFAQLSPWVWHVYLNGNRVGTVNRDGVSGFIARDNDHHSIGEGYHSAEAAMKAWIPAMRGHR